MSPSTLALLSLSVTVGLVILFSIEARRGKRFLGRLRTYIDNGIERRIREFHARIPRVNRVFFSYLFHYLIHRIVARLLVLTRLFERGLRFVAHLNRKKATERQQKQVDVDPHLRAIAEHKEEVALSPKEQKEWKDAVLRGEQPVVKPKRRVAPKAE